jgi:hypothetical protein
MILDHSSLHVWRQCKRKFYWTYLQELDSGRSDAMERGRLAHEILYIYHKTGSLEDAFNATSFERPEGMLQQEEQKYKELEWATKELVRGYTTKVKEEYKIIDVEVPMAYHIFGSNYYVGVVDGIVEVPEGFQLINEYKTTSQIPEGWITKFQLDQQTTGYVFLARHNGFPVKGAILNILRATKYPDYVRDTVLTPDWLIDEWEREVKNEMLHIEEAIEALERYGYQAMFPKSTDACFAYNTKCPFHKLCTESPRNREVMLSEGFFKKRKPRELGILQQVKDREAKQKGVRPEETPSGAPQEG